MEGKFAKLTVFILRISLGSIFFYAGITKILNHNWTSAGYLKGAKTFTGFYSWLTLPGNIGLVDFLNEWGLTLIGISLILGVFVRFSSVFGAFLMILYWFPILKFPYVGDHSLIVDEHIIYLFVFILFAVVGAGRIWGLDKLLYRRKFSLLG